MAATASSDEGSCSTLEPAVGSTLLQVHRGRPNHGKSAQKSKSIHGKTDSPDPQWGWPSDNLEDFKYEGDLSYQVEKEDPSNQAEVAAEVPGTREQRRQRNGKHAHAKDFYYRVPGESEQREQGNVKKAHAKDFFHRVEQGDSSTLSEAAAVVPNTREQQEQGNVEEEHTQNGKGKPQKETADVFRLAPKIGARGACKSHPCRLKKPDDKERNLGKTASLDDAGYRKVAALEDDEVMAEYVARVLDTCDFRVENMRGMMAMVPWFSGTTAVQSFEALEDALLHAALVGADEPWLTHKNSAGVSGDNADLGVVGYVQVAALRDGAEMIKFAKRLCKQMGVRIVDESGFESSVQSYIGSYGFQSFERLAAELRSAANAPHTWATWGKRPSMLASTQRVLSADAAAFDRAAVRVSAQGFCTRHPCGSLLAAQAQPSGRGKHASLDEAGYQQVARLKDDKEMREFILRVIALYDCKVMSDGGLSGIVPWFSGTAEVQSFGKLEEVLLFAIVAKDAWIKYRNTARISGNDAPLSLTGYVQVAALKSTNEMKKFARRLCKDLGIKIVNEGGFEGMVNFYSGSQNFQSYESLVSEIKSAARAPNSWAKKM